MLKLTYTETGFNLERLAQSLEQVVTRRAVVAMRLGQSFVAEPTTASFLLPADLPEIYWLEEEMRRDSDSLSVCVADAEYVEVSLRGVWLATNSHTADGVFVTVLPDRAEFYILKSWQASISNPSLLKEAGE
ncbi:MAG TPA: hypothetical protein IGS52_19430 [Oscillatoriaceae cyanobacterium M33_DOE_052]|uniref:Uncharacterized protein n=1 Tax=Planktothricoides sp. SpSt-374 TaxID=2282167 RepID=A0A7C3VIA4_9CYAN|nr:hypothetical protein [Oscillatoriaceae cyanobacterium M33_DOE_052]